MIVSRQKQKFRTLLAPPSAPDEWDTEPRGCILPIAFFLWGVFSGYIALYLMHSFG